MGSGRSRTVCMHIPSGIQACRMHPAIETFRSSCQTKTLPKPVVAVHSLAMLQVPHQLPKVWKQSTSFTLRSATPQFSGHRNLLELSNVVAAADASLHVKLRYHEERRHYDSRLP